MLRMRIGDASLRIRLELRQQLELLDTSAVMHETCIHVISKLPRFSLY
jgi:hypothetical protein